MKKMTNAQKYEEGFGFPPDKVGCPTKTCDECPVKGKNLLSPCDTKEWWNSEYKEPNKKDDSHDCGTCKHNRNIITEEPCSSCDIRLGNNKLEPEEEEDGDKS